MKAGESRGHEALPGAECLTSNVERRTSKVGGSEPVIYDIEERLLEYAARVIRLVEALQNRKAATHVGGQLMRSGTSPLSNHGEAQAAESLDDFIHKLKVCLKELNESQRWLKLIHRVPLLDKPRKAESLLQETRELCAIFAKSIQTAKRRKRDEDSARVREDSPLTDDDRDPWLLGPWVLEVRSSMLEVNGGSPKVEPPAGPVRYGKGARKK